MNNNIVNETIKNQLNHRSIRRFKDKAVEPKVIKTLLDVANQTSSSVAMQGYSIIRITDSDLKKEISDICMQKHVSVAPEVWIFVVDAYRNAKIAASKDVYTNYSNSMDRFFQGFSDALLSAQNVMVALESLGLGGVFLGSILNDSQKLIDLLDLPEYTFPALGLEFGYPDENPDIKPRMELELKVFENKYKREEDYGKAIEKYDDIMRDYYENREDNFRLESFSSHVVNMLSRVIEPRVKILNTIRKQGFEFALEYIPENEIKRMYKNLPKEVDEEVFDVSRLGFKSSSSVKEMFEKYPFVKEYLLMINPRFNVLKTITASSDFEKVTLELLAEMGDMPMESLIYMIESRIDEE